MSTVVFLECPDWTSPETYERLPPDVKASIEKFRPQIEANAARARRFKEEQRKAIERIRDAGLREAARTT